MPPNSPSLRIFAARERALLERAIHNCVVPPGVSLELVDPEGNAFWGTGGGVQQQGSRAVLAGALERAEEAAFGNVVGEIDLCVQDVRWGAIRVRSASGARRVRQEARQALETMAEFLRGCLERESERQDLFKRYSVPARQLVAVHNVTCKARERWDLTERLVMVLEEAVSLSGASAGVFVIEESGQQRFLTVPAGTAERRLGLELVQAASEYDAAHLGDPVEIDPDSPGKNMWSYVGAPFVADEECKGWLLLGRKADEPDFDVEDRKLVETLVELAADFVQGRRLQDRLLFSARRSTETEIAEGIRRRLAPIRYSTEEWVELGAVCRPAEAVGKEFYLIAQEPERSCLVVVGVVSGPPIEANLQVESLHAGLRLLNGEETSLAFLLERLSRLLPDPEGKASLKGLSLARYLPADGTLELASVGDAPEIFLWRGAGLSGVRCPQSAERFDSQPISPRFEAFGEGHVLCIATPGVLEAPTGEGAHFGVDGLEEGLREHATEPPARILHALVSALDRHTGAKFGAGDQTIVVVKGRSAP